MTKTHLPGEVFDLSAEEKADYIRSRRWIGYTRALDIIKKLNSLVTYPKSHRMPNALVVGPTNNGKTSIIERFQSLNKPYESEFDGQMNVPVLVVECPPAPDELRLYNAILETLNIPYRATVHVDTQKKNVKDMLLRLNTKVLVLDEIHNILSGNPTKQRQMLNTIKFLGNELRIPFVGCGTKEAMLAIKADAQLENRFHPLVLPPWNLNSGFQSLLASFEAMLPLRESSGLSKPSMAKKIHLKTRGIIGEVSELISEAAIIAINEGRECIAPEDLELGDTIWMTPAQRFLAHKEL